jgi:hypothetical protein
MRHLIRGSLVRTLLVLALAAPILVAAPVSAHAVGYDVRAQVINTAIAQLGKPYSWGTAGPNTFDCSGLVRYCYAAAGMNVPSVDIANMSRSGMMWSQCETCTVDKLEPGDLLFHTNLADHSKEPTTGFNISHVGIYVGAGRVIHAPGTGQKVCYTSTANFRFVGRLRAQYWPNGDRTYDPPALLHGDFTGDGRDDAAYFYGLGGAAIKAMVLKSNGTTFGPAETWYTNTRWDWNHTKVVTGDFNRDGKTDIAALYDYGGKTVKLWAYLSDGTKFKPVVWWTSASGGWDWSRTRLVSADFDGDHKTDVGLVYDDGNAATHLYVARSTGTSFLAPASWWYSGIRGWDAKLSKVTAGDLTGDGKGDIAILQESGRSSSKLWVFASTGSAFSAAQVWRSWTGDWDWNRTKLTAADVNGDKRADLVALYDQGSSSSALYSFVSTGSGFSPTKLFWQSSPGGWNWERVNVGIGDFGRTGRSDVQMLYDYGSAQSKAWRFESKTDATVGRVSCAWGSAAGALDWNRVK